MVEFVKYGLQNLAMLKRDKIFLVAACLVLFAIPAALCFLGFIFLISRILKGF